MKKMLFIALALGFIAVGPVRALPPDPCIPPSAYLSVLTWDSFIDWLF
jgi:hypothetical protein